VVTIRLRERRDHRLAHPRVEEERALDLAGLDPEAADLDLEVAPAEELERPVPAPARQVPRAVEPAAAERVGHEALRGQLRAPEIAPRETRAPHGELAGAAHGERREGRIEHVCPARRDRPADRHRSRPQAGPQPVGGREGGVLGRAVAVDDLHSGERRERPLDVGVRQRVAAREELAQAGQPRQTLLHRQVEQPRGEPERRDAVARHRPVDVRQGERPGRQERQAAAVEERPPELEGRHVERHRHELEEDLAGTEGRVARLAHQPHHRPVGDLDALRRPGRARGVEHVGEPRGRHLHPRIVTGLRVLLHVLVRQARRPPGERREQPPRAGDRRRRRVGEEQLEALPRIARIERQVSSAGFQDADDGRHHLGRALGAEGHPHLRPDPQAVQPPRDLAGPAVEPAVGERAAVPLDGDRLRSRRRLLLEEPVHGDAREVRRRVVPLRRHLVALRLGKERQGGDRELRRRRRAVEESREVREKARRGRRGEEIRRVLQLEGQRRPSVAVLQLLHHQRQVELRRRPLARRQRCEAQRRGVPRGGGPGGRRPAGALQGQQYLDEGVARQVALRPQRFDQRLERQVLVGEGAERHLAHRRQEAAELRIARELRAQRQRVDEEPDEPLGLRPRPVRHRCADQQILLAGVAREERREAGEEQHVEGRPLPPRRPAQPRRRRRREEQPAARPAEALHRRPRMVGRQIERRRRAGQPLPPVGELALQHRRRPGALPAGVVGVLHWQLAERRWPPLHGCGIES
jgi:hypothetical protein